MRRPKRWPSAHGTGSGRTPTAGSGTSQRRSNEPPATRMWAPMSSLGHGMGGQSAVLADGHAASAVGRVAQGHRAGRVQFLEGDGVGGDGGLRRRSRRGFRPRRRRPSPDAPPAARSATSGGRPSGRADHTPMPGLVRSPLTVVTTPSAPGSARIAAITAAVACRTKLLNGPPANAMPPVMVGVVPGRGPGNAVVLAPRRGSSCTPR